MMGSIKTSAKILSCRNLLRCPGLHFCQGKPVCKQFKNVDNIKIFGYVLVFGIRAFVCEIHKIIRLQSNYFHAFS